MFITTLAVIAIIVAVFVAIVAMRPSEFRIERSAAMSAPVPAVFAHVNDLHKWQAFSPWAKMDPSAKNTFSGPLDGVGAVFEWAGNRQVGQGRMTIVESRSNELIRFRLDFLKPFAATNTAVFTFKPDGDQTVVTWSMSGRSNFMFKAMGLFMNCDKMVGGQFEQGLANLKLIVETKG
ncbi:MAG TPA: SRPBCC family protein [Rariglobus sp.]|jgi:hypothetical protein|nr:SRPBCC family protein [Rariglobus sp.]